jgi:hypothetical protein
MSQSNSKVYAALVIACAALALAIHAEVRGASDAPAAGSSVFIDRDARAQLDKLRHELAERDAIIARLTRAASASGGTAAATEPALVPTAPSAPLEQGPRRYVHFEIPNPAVSVTQKDDGTYDIRTTDPSLAGTVMQITAVTQSGEENKLLIRIP